MIEAVEFKGTPEKRLYELGLSYIQFGFDNEAAYRVAFMTPNAKGMHDSKVAILAAGLNAFSVLRDLFAEVLGDHNREIDIRAQSCWASVHGIVALRLDRPEFPWEPQRTLVDSNLRRLAATAFSAPDISTRHLGHSQLGVKSTSARQPLTEVAHCGSQSETPKRPFSSPASE